MESPTKRQSKMLHTLIFFVTPAIAKYSESRSNSMLKLIKKDSCDNEREGNGSQKLTNARISIYFRFMKIH